MSLNSSNKNIGDRWGITRYLDCVSCKHHTSVLCFVKVLEFLGEIDK